METENKATKLLAQMRTEIDEVLSAVEDHSIEPKTSTGPSENELDRHDWKLYAHGTGSWIRNTLDFQDLARKIDENGGKVRIGKYVYQLRGDQKQFIARFPI